MVFVARSQRPVAWSLGVSRVLLILVFLKVLESWAAVPVQAGLLQNGASYSLLRSTNSLGVSVSSSWLSLLSLAELAELGRPLARPCPWAFPDSSPTLTAGYARTFRCGSSWQTMPGVDDIDCFGPWAFPRFFLRRRVDRLVRWCRLGWRPCCCRWLTSPIRKFVSLGVSVTDLATVAVRFLGRFLRLVSRSLRFLK